jgi:glycosyltransferase involved in cell wall biosynthesis
MRKKILIIHHSGRIGGAGISLLHILEALKENSRDIIVYCPNRPDHMINEIKKIGYECISNPSNIPTIEHYSGSDRSILSYWTLRNLINLLTKRDEIKKMIRTISPDIVIVNTMTLCYVGKIAKSMGIKTICFHRETYAKGWFGIRSKFIKRSLSDDFDKVVFISRFDSMESGNLSSDTSVIYDKVKLDEFDEESHNSNSLKLSNGIINVLYTGGMSALKGSHILIEALAKCNSNIHLTFLQYDGVKHKKSISNYPELKNKLRFLFGKDQTATVLSLIDDYGLWDRVHFYPVTNNVSTYFKDCDIVVFPSTSAHQARPIYEAGAAHKPIIITDSENISEFVSDGENGFVFKKGDSVKLAYLINKLSVDAELRNDMGRKNYLKAVNNHDFSKLKNELLNVIEGI